MRRPSGSSVGRCATQAGGLALLSCTRKRPLQPRRSDQSMRAPKGSGRVRDDQQGTHLDRGVTLVKQPGRPSRHRLAVVHYRRVRNAKVAALALLAFAMLITSLDQYIVVVALPSIGSDLGFSAQTLQWVISAYAVTSAGFLLLGGRAADLLGRRRIFVTGVALYGGASLAGGVAPTPEFLLGARAVQGLG